MKRPFVLIYGVIAYILFNLSFLYMLGFLQALFVPKAINDGPQISAPYAALINVGLIFLFGFFHSLMARQWFKDWWTRIIPKAAERSTYVLQSALFLGLAMWLWQPMPTTLWSVGGGLAAMTYAVFVLGVVMVLLSTFLIDHFDFFGLRQIWCANRERPIPKPEFRTPFLYRIVRHPMQLGIIMVFFGTPLMTAGHMLFALSMTAYVLIGLWFEERALLREFGDAYRDYQNRVPMLIPGLGGIFRGQPQSH
ncbi:MAG: isoprenylcysteine carboxylmethyltransferase family protein [Paracoccaceae bacterium]|nr:isoprenylcysteine carboxylmethyltransferase family protein [Paracoccaceae bacterium]